jgi:hypothetical protein
MHAVGQEIVIFPLFAVSNHWRACGFEPVGVSDYGFKERCEGRIFGIDLREPLDQMKRPGDTANRLSGYGDWPRAHVYLRLAG